MVELDGVAQAFAVVLPNLNEITEDLDGKLLPFGLPKVISRVRNHRYKTARLMLFGIRKALQRKAVGGAVILAFIEEFRRRISAISDRSNIANSAGCWKTIIGMRKPIEMSGAKIDKIHRIYGKDLTAADGAQGGRGLKTRQSDLSLDDWFASKVDRRPSQDAAFWLLVEHEFAGGRELGTR